MAIVRGRFVHMASDKPAPASTVPLEEQLSTQQKSRLRNIGAQISGFGGAKYQAGDRYLAEAGVVLVSGDSVVLTAKGLRALERIRAGHRHGRG